MKGPIVTLGEILAVFLGDQDVPLDAATRFDRGFAGAESNVAVALARSGVSAAFIGRIGADALGRAALRFLRGEGVDVSGVIVDDAATGLLVRSSTGTGSTEVVYGRRGSAGSRLNVTDINEATIASARALHLTGITVMLSPTASEACLRACTVARDHGVPISFDPNLRLRLAPLPAWQTSLRPFFELADVVLTGADEARQLSGVESAEEAARWITEQGPSLIVMKDGAAGATAWQNGTQLIAPALPAIVRDPVGAGDAFNAGFLGSWYADCSLETAMESGARFGAATVAVRGDTTGIASQKLEGNNATYYSDVLR